MLDPWDGDPPVNASPQYLENMVTTMFSTMSSLVSSVAVTLPWG